MPKFAVNPTISVFTWSWRNCALLFQVLNWSRVLAGLTWRSFSGDSGMKFVHRAVAKFLHYYPIKSRSPFRFFPVFFCLGAGIEWFMINVPAAGAGETFYDVYRRNISRRQFGNAEGRLAEEDSPAEDWSCGLRTELLGKISKRVELHEI